MSQDDSRPHLASRVIDGASAPATVRDFSRTTDDVLRHVVDPEWLLFIACLLVPALVCALGGDSDRSIFFARLALYIGFLKWLGWLILTRPAPDHRSFLKFPQEIFVGLSFPLLWFYLRNVFAVLVPGSYSLIELGVLAWLAAGLQVAGGLAVHVGAIRQRSLSWRETGRALAVRICVCLPFALTLMLTLWSVAKEIFVPSQDGWFHSFIARVFLNDGLFYAHFNGNHPIFYTSGFGAINAITAAISGLTVVQAQNLQHVLMIVTGVWLLSSTVSLLARRVLLPLYLLPTFILSAYPLHNLPPDVYWTHTPQQTATAFLLAIPLVSLAIPISSRITFYSALALQSLLSLAVLALSPVCAFFLPGACLVALFVNCARGRALFRERVLKLCASQAAFILLASVLVLGSDRYYSTVLLNPSGASYMRSEQYGGDGSHGSHQLLGFSLRRALTAVVEPMVLIPDRAEDPPEKLPGRFLPWLAVALGIASCGFAVGRRQHTTPAFRHLAITAGVSLVLWLAMKYWATFFSAGITSTTLDALLLQSYLIFMARRLELWLLLLVMLASATCLYLVPGAGRERLLARTVAGGAVVMLGVWWLPLAASHLDPRVSHLIPRNIGVAGRITRDDIELTRWIDKNLPPGEGLIGLTSMPFKLAESKLLFPIDAGQTLSLYGEHYNFCFQVFDPSRPYGFDDYTERVLYYFDAQWCVNNGIRYFHVPRADIYPNHGLARAAQIGLLEPVRTVSSSVLYAVRPLPWTPVLVPGPKIHETSHEIAWQANGGGIAQGHDPQIVFKLDAPQFVHAIRFKYTLSNQQAVALAQLFWKNRGQEFVESERTARLRLEVTPGEQTLTVLVHDTIESFRFDPDIRPCTFRIRDIELLVKPSATPNRGSAAR